MYVVMNPGFSIYFFFLFFYKTSNTGKPAFSYYILLENEDFSLIKMPDAFFFSCKV